MKTLCRQLTFQVYIFSLHLQKREEQNRVWNVTLRGSRREEKEKTEAADSLVELSSNSDGIVYPSDTVTVAIYPNPISFKLRFQALFQALLQALRAISFKLRFQASFQALFPASVSSFASSFVSSFSS